MLKSRDFLQQRAGVREVILSNILPSPAQKININDLVDFKARHGDLLQRFRNKVESTCTELTNLSDSEAMEDQIRYTISEFKEEIGQITDIMRGRWTHIVFNSLVPLLGAGGTLAATPLNQPVAFAATGILLVDAIYKAFSEEKRYQETLHQPLAYAALARSTFRWSQQMSPN